MRAGARSPLLVVHPWELVDRPVPGLFTGFARFFHDAGREGFRESLPPTLARSLRTRTLAEVAEAARSGERAAQETVAGRTPELELAPSAARIG